MNLPPLYERLLHPQLRGDLTLWAAAVAILFGGMFLRGHFYGAVIPAACAVLGLLFRWTGMPILAVLTLAYFLVFPTGLPADAVRSADVRTSAFGVIDSVLVLAVLGYLATQYRLFSLTGPAKPYDLPKYARREGDDRRSAEAVREAELPPLGAGLVVAVFAGQFVWMLATVLEPTFEGFPPVRLVPEGKLIFAGRATPSVASGPVSRFLMVAGLFAMVLLPISFAFWYWRLATLRADEANLLLRDTQWADARREMARQETWRAWGRGQRAPKKPRKPWRLLVWLLFGALLVVCIGCLNRFLRWFT